jgi:hypothetical protein
LSSFGTGKDTGTEEKSVSPSKEKAQNQVPSPTKSSGGNYTSDSGLPAFQAQKSVCERSNVRAF